MAFNFLNSRIFPSTPSAIDLQASSMQNRHPYANAYSNSQLYNSQFAHTDTATDRLLPTQPPPRPQASKTQASLIDRPDHGITALPKTAGHTIPEMPKPRKVKAERKKKYWARVKTGLRVTWKRLTKRKAEAGMVIGEPYNCQRVGGAETLERPGYGEGGRGQEMAGGESQWESDDEYKIGPYFAPLWLLMRLQD